MLEEPQEFQKSLELFERAKKVIPGGSNQVHRLVQPFLFFNSGKGSRIYDVDNNEYLDYHCAYGPIVLGHHYPSVDKAVVEALSQGADLFGVGGTEMELHLHEKIVEHFPSADMALLCTSGSEANYFAIRVARAFTKRKKLIKFQGHYHGFFDSVLLNVISPPNRLDTKDPGSEGILNEVIEQTIVVPWNDIDAFEKTVSRFKDEIAAVILEPIPHNIGCILPYDGYLKAVRETTSKNNILLIFDEVVTGIRHDLGGMQKLWGISPDITTLGKAIANGYPISAVCGRGDIMTRAMSAPNGDVFFGGTFNGHPLGVAAALATIREMESKRVHEHIFRLGEMMRIGLADIAKELEMKVVVSGFGSVFVEYFMNGPIVNYSDLLRNNERMSLQFRRALVEKGIFFLPKNLKRNHITYSHTDQDIRDTLDAARSAFSTVATK